MHRKGEPKLFGGILGKQGAGGNKGGREKGRRQSEVLFHGGGRELAHREAPGTRGVKAESGALASGAPDKGAVEALQGRRLSTTRFKRAFSDGLHVMISGSSAKALCTILRS